MSFLRFKSGESASAILAAFFVGVASLSACKRSDSSAPAAGSSTATAAASPASTSGAATATSAAAKPVPEAVTKLLGRWMRSDGGYVLELRKADISGAIEAGYFNPKSINVSRAIWMQGAAGLQVMVELNDVGYPGATYVLSHDAATDRLVGQYNQPAMQQSFEIDFVRQPKP